LEDRRNVGESSRNSGDGTDQRVQSLMFMMMMIITEFKLRRNEFLWKSGHIYIPSIT
jgi:hypothetical protein